MLCKVAADASLELARVLVDKRAVPCFLIGRSVQLPSVFAHSRLSPCKCVKAYGGEPQLLRLLGSSVQIFRVLEWHRVVRSAVHQ